MLWRTNKGIIITNYIGLRKNMMQNQAQLIKHILHALDVAVVKIQGGKIKFYLYPEIHQLKAGCPLLNYILYS